MAKHHSHRHELSLKSYKQGFVCDGCKTDGFGERYRCVNSCDYDLHKECMRLAPTRSLESFPGLTFRPLDRPPPPADRRACDVCKKDVEGFVYHCEEAGLDVHPLCAALKRRVRVDGAEFELKEGARGRCNWCEKRRLRDSEEKIPGFCYVSRFEGEECSFHVHCLMAMGIESAARSTVHSYEDGDDEVAVSETRMRRYNGRRGWGGGRSMFVRVVKMFLKVVLSVLFGDPTAIIASVVVELLAP